MDKNKSPVTFTKKDVEIIERKKCYHGFFSIFNYLFRYRCFNGKMSREILREVFERKPTAVLLPYDPLRDQVVLIEQIRIPAFDGSPTPWLLEVIAGIIETGETPEQAARREAIEEAGLKIKRVQNILSYLTSPGGTSERLSFLIGEVDLSLAKKKYICSQDEDIYIHIVSRSQAYYWVEKGIIDNAASIIALQWLELHYKKLTEKWKL